MRLPGVLTALRRVRVWLGHALLVAFVLKALIPAGYMPDFSGRDGQAFKIVICTANGTKLIDSDDFGDDTNNGSSAKHAGEPCALGGLAVSLLPGLSATVDLPRLLDTTIGGLELAVVLPPARAGPAHSPRAPPALV